MSSTRQHIRIHEYKTDIAQHHPKPRMNSLEKFWSQNFWDFFQKMKNDTHKVVVEGGFTGDRGRFFWKSWKILRRTWPNEPWKSPKTIRRTWPNAPWKSPKTIGRTWLRYCTPPLTVYSTVKPPRGYKDTKNVGGVVGGGWAYQSGLVQINLSICQIN